jgi:phytoene synthase
MNPLLQQYHNASFATSREVTRTYSTSFALAIRLLSPSIRDAIRSVYGFVRLADEIVDSFHGYDREALLDQCVADVYRALDDGISLNPVLHSFQLTAHRYGIGRDLVDAFLDSMRKDLTQSAYDRKEYEAYIYGSADVVGLMCLKVFVGGDAAGYERLKPYAMKLGSAFQKVNFLRDVRDDFMLLNRTYFPGVDLQRFTDDDKREILDDIRADFREALKGIRMLPPSSRFGVYTAYLYYKRLLRKLEITPPSEILRSRIRVPNYQKLLLIVYSFFRMKLRWT